MVNPVGQPVPGEHKADHAVSRSVPVAVAAPAPKEVSMTTPSLPTTPTAAAAAYPAPRTTRGSFATVISTAADGRPKVTTVGNWA